MHCSPLLVILYKDTLISAISPDLGNDACICLYFQFSFNLVFKMHSTFYLQTSKNNQSGLVWIVISPFKVGQNRNLLSVCACLYMTMSNTCSHF